MRRVIVAAALVSVALAGAAGCADNGSKTEANGTNATSTGGADQTKQVCQDAIATSSAGFADFQSKYKAFMTAATSGDMSKIDSFEAVFDKLAGDWKAKLTELSAKPIKPAVKAVLVEGVATVDMISSDDTQLTADQLQARLTEFNTKLTTACA